MRRAERGEGGGERTPRVRPLLSLGSGHSLCPDHARSRRLSRRDKARRRTGSSARRADDHRERRRLRRRHRRDGAHDQPHDRSLLAARPPRGPCAASAPGGRASSRTGAGGRYERPRFRSATARRACTAEAGARRDGSPRSRRDRLSRSGARRDRRRHRPRRDRLALALARSSKGARISPPPRATPAVARRASVFTPARLARAVCPRRAASSAAASRAGGKLSATSEATVPRDGRAAWAGAGARVGVEWTLWSSLAVRGHVEGLATLTRHSLALDAAPVYTFAPWSGDLALALVWHFS